LYYAVNKYYVYYVVRNRRSYISSKDETQSLKDGQPSETSPSPPKTEYALAASRFSKEGTSATLRESREGTGAPKMSVGRLPAAKICHNSQSVGF
jgi:hypothetical protein